MAPKEITMLRGIHSGRQSRISWSFGRDACRDESAFGLISNLVQYFPYRTGRLFPCTFNMTEGEITISHWWEFSDRYQNIHMHPDTVVRHIGSDVILISYRNAMVRINRRRNHVAVFSNSEWDSDALRRIIRAR